MKLSVVILNYNVRYFLEQCILSCQQAIRTIDAEIIVIDNASSDESGSMVREKFPEVLYIQNEENVGFSKANNQAVTRAKGEFVCILNPDTAVASDTFTRCIQFAESNLKMGALGGYYLDGTGNFLPECKRNLPTPFRSLLKLIGLGQGKNGYYAKQVPKESVGTVEILAGAFLFLKKEVYLEAKGFDEDYFMYGEDIDLSYKIAKLGYTNFYNGHIKILHYKGESTQKDQAYFERFYGAMQIFFQKHFSQNRLLNTLVKWGVAYAKFSKGRKTEKQEESFDVDEIWVLTEDLALLRALATTYDLPVKSVAVRAVEEDLLERKMLVFDTTYLSYQVIFELMIKQKNRQNKFRIRPPGCNFIIGSDQSDHKGEVVKL